MNARLIQSCVALTLLLLVASALSQDAESIRRPYIEKGDRWTYRGTNILGPGTDLYDVMVSFSDGDTVNTVCTRKQDGKEFDSTYTGEWNMVVSYSGRVMRPNTGHFKFPLAVGTTFQSAFDMIWPKVSSAVIRIEDVVTVKGWEEIEVPAGRFRAIKVQIEGTGQRSDQQRPFRFTQTYWYSPTVHRWVKLMHVPEGGEGFSEELVEYKLNQ